MKHDRRLIYTDKSDFTDYCKHEDYVRSIANTITARCRLSGGWNVVSVINEAFYQATALHWDFSKNIFFLKDYYEVSVKDMPLNVANAVYSVVYLLLRQSGGAKDVLRMIEEKLSSRPVFQALKSMPDSNVAISFYPDTEYFYNSDYVDWNTFTNGFTPANVSRVMTIAETYEHNIMTARGIYGQLRSFAVARNLCGEAFYVESVNILRQYIGIHIENDVFFGDEVNEEKVLGVPFLGFVQSSDEGKNQRLAEMQAQQDELTQKLEQVKEQLELQYRQTEEYKKDLAEMKKDLGRARISFDEIAERILALPSSDRWRVCSEVTMLLMGTVWTEKKVAEVMAKIKEKEEKARGMYVETFNNNGTFNNVAIAQPDQESTKLIE